MPVSVGTETGEHWPPAWWPSSISAPQNFLTVTAFLPAARPPCCCSVVQTRISNIRVFCPCVQRKSIPDAHVRKPHGADAVGDVVSIEPLQKVTTLALDRGPLNGGPYVAGDPRSSLWRASPLTEIRACLSNAL